MGVSLAAGKAVYGSYLTRFILYSSCGPGYPGVPCCTAFRTGSCVAALPIPHANRCYLYNMITVFMMLRDCFLCIYEGEQRFLRVIFSTMNPHFCLSNLLFPSENGCFPPGRP